MAEKDLVVDDEGKVLPDAVQEEHLEDDEHDEELSAEASASETTDDEGDTQDNTPDVDPEREAIRQRRRDERKHKKEAQREREDSLRRELESERSARQQLEQRLTTVERKSNGAEMATLDNHLKQTADAYNHFKNQIAVASAAGDHASIADATEKMILARDRYNQLENIKKGYQRQQSAPPPLDPRLQQHAQGWLERNNWYDPDGQDEDSAVASKIDERLASEGWNPTTPQYWQELDSRLKKYLPHRYKVGHTSQGNSRQAKSPVAGSGRESSGNNSSGSYRLSADRVSALKDAGIEPGSPEFARMVKSYKDYDKQQSAAN